MSDQLRKTLIERVALARGWDTVEVVIVRKDYAARVAKRMGVDRMIRGLRNAADLASENELQLTNVQVIANLKTIFIIPPLDLSSVSSTFVRGLISDEPVGWHWKVQRFIPKEVYEEVRINWLRKQWHSIWAYGSNMTEQAITSLDNAFRELTGPSMYGDPNRPYHNLDHLVHGLSEIGAYFANNPLSSTGYPYTVDDEKELKKGFFLHDAFTLPRADGLSPEEASARYAEGLIQRIDALPVSSGVPTLVRLTDHLQSHDQAHRFANIMIGADLAILGQGSGEQNGERDDSIAYENYAKNVRLEYSQYSDAEYAVGRAKVLTHLLQKAKAGELFQDDYFSWLYNESAISNLESELRSHQAGR